VKKRGRVPGYLNLVFLLMGVNTSAMRAKKRKPTGGFLRRGKQDWEGKYDNNSYSHIINSIRGGKPRLRGSFDD